MDAVSPPIFLYGPGRLHAFAAWWTDPPAEVLTVLLEATAVVRKLATEDGGLISDDLWTAICANDKDDGKPASSPADTMMAGPTG